MWSLHLSAKRGYLSGCHVNDPYKNHGCVIYNQLARFNLSPVLLFTTGQGAQTVLVQVVALSQRLH
jgi:hypothetical protein